MSLAFPTSLYILLPHNMSNTLSYSHSGDFVSFSAKISEEYPLPDTTNEHQLYHGLPRSLLDEQLVPYAASFMDPQDFSDSSSGSSNSDPASPFRDSLIYMPSDECELSTTGGLTHHSLSKRYVAIFLSHNSHDLISLPRLPSPLTRSQDIQDVSGLIFVEPDSGFGYAPLFETNHASMEKDIQALAPYFYSQDIAEQPSAPTSLLFGFTDHYPSPSSASTDDSSPPCAAATIDAALLSSEPQQERVHMANAYSSPQSYLAAEVQQQPQVFDPRDSNMIDISFNTTENTRRRDMRSSTLSSDEDESCLDEDYCESDADEDNGDGEFTLEQSTSTVRISRRRRNSEPSFASDGDDEFQDSISDLALPPRPRVMAPVPVPGLVKKSRGRRVPTASSVVASGGIQKSSRSYKCIAEGCGKCFARGEHLKRHVRSIHTNEKRT